MRAREVSRGAVSALKVYATRDVEKKKNGFHIMGTHMKFRFVACTNVSYIFASIQIALKE